MKKGEISTDTLFHIGLFVVLLGLVVALLLGPFRNIAMSLMDQLFGWVELSTSGEKEAQILLEAIECAYKRCERGCDGIRDGRYVNCNSSFCGPMWQDSEGKICGFNAVQYPVEVELDEGPKINKISSDYRKFDCIYSSEGGSGDLGDFFSFIWGAIGGGEDEYNILTIGENLIDHSEETECRIPGSPTDQKSYNNLELYSGNMYISSGHRDTHNKELTLTIVDPNPSYHTITYGIDNEVTFVSTQENVNYRLVVDKGPYDGLQFYIRFDNIRNNRVEVHVGCRAGIEEPTGTGSRRIDRGSTSTFCGDLEVTFIERDSGDVVMNFMYDGSSCYWRPPSNCLPMCDRCSKEPSWDHEPNICCHPGEKCNDGVCENYVDPLCHYLNEDHCSSTEGCKEGRLNVGSDNYFVECCYVWEDVNQHGICEPSDWGIYTTTTSIPSILSCYDLCSPHDNRCPEECSDCSYMPDGSWICMTRCGDICSPSSNNCPSECPNCAELPDGRYHCSSDQPVVVTS